MSDDPVSDSPTMVIKFKDLSPAIVDLLTKGERLSALAERGYMAYGDLAGWRNYLGRPMPRWEELPERTRKYWMAAASAIVRKATSDARSLPIVSCEVGTPSCLTDHSCGQGE